MLGVCQWDLVLRLRGRGGRKEKGKKGATASVDDDAVVVVAATALVLFFPQRVEKKNERTRTSRYFLRRHRRAAPLPSACASKPFLTLIHLIHCQKYRCVESGARFFFSFDVVFVVGLFSSGIRVHYSGCLCRR